MYSKLYLLFFATFFATPFFGRMSCLNIVSNFLLSRVLNVVYQQQSGATLTRYGMGMI